MLPHGMAMVDRLIVTFAGGCGWREHRVACGMLTLQEAEKLNTLARSARQAATNLSSRVHTKGKPAALSPHAGRVAAHQ